MAQQPTVEVVGERKTNWWLVVGGIILLLFAIGTFAYPLFFLELVTIWAGLGFVFAGATGVATYFRVRGVSGAIWSLIMAVLDIVVGIMMLIHPMALAPVIPWFLGAGFIVFGIVEIVGTASLGMLVPESRPLTVVSGLLTVVVGIMFIIWPTSLSIWIAAFAAVRGVTLIMMGFMSRS